MTGCTIVLSRRRFDAKLRNMGIGSGRNSTDIGYF